ncbi:helix-turn-helix domain-containing protein [Nonomuraea typhae]|uniref:Helix-turn-helix domain-containing protein n=1 Tax=Nonomuraea typhae TaxID=2603600 RepID=A0ABW7Z7Y4_9ACTN
MLEALGLTGEEEAIYRHLVARPSASAAEIGAALTLPVPRADELLRSLAARGLAGVLAGEHVAAVPPAVSGERFAAVPPAVSGERFAAVPPAVALGALLTVRREELRTAELALIALAEEHRSAATGRAIGDLIEIVTGVEAVRQRFAQVQHAAAHQVRSFSTAPFAAVPVGADAAGEQGVKRGIRYRMVVERDLLAAPGATREAMASLRQGVQVRVADRLPIRLIMADSALALVLLSTSPSDPPGAVLLHGSGLLAALEALFEAVWERARPLRTDGADGITELDTKILSLLLAGLTDEAVAGQLDLSLRTLQRRIRQLMDQAGVRTRVQLGWQAARRGWA